MASSRKAVPLQIIFGSSGIWSDRIVNCSLSGTSSCTCISFACSSHRMHRCTEAYGLKLLESTERIDAARHTTEGTELIACVASPRLSMAKGSCTCISLLVVHHSAQTSKQSFLWILASRSVGYSVDSKSFMPVGFCVVCAFCGNYIQKNYK